MGSEDFYPEERPVHDHDIKTTRTQNLMAAAHVGVLDVPALAGATRPIVWLTLE